MSGRQPPTRRGAVCSSEYQNAMTMVSMMMRMMVLMSTMRSVCFCVDIFQKIFFVFFFQREKKKTERERERERERESKV